MVHFRGTEPSKADDNMVDGHAMACLKESNMSNHFSELLNPVLRREGMLV